MSHGTEPDWTALVAYLSSTCSADERARIEAWMASDETHRQQVAHLRAAWNSVRPVSLPPVNVATMRDAVLGQASSLPASPRVARTATRSGPYRWRRAMTVSAGTVACGALALWAGHRATTREVPSYTYHAARGERVTVPLADSSSMTLAPATTAVVRGATVQLDGEAQFVVTPRAARAFTVRTRNAIVQVLGTTFTVRQYPGERDSRVMVREGRVSLSTRAQATTANIPTSAIVLVAGTMGRVTDSVVSPATKIDPENYAAWASGALVFEDALLRDVLADLSRAYDVDIRVSDSVLATQSMTLRVSVTKQSLAEVLGYIEIAADAHVVRDSGGFMLARGRRAGTTQRHLTFPPVEKQYGR